MTLRVLQSNLVWVSDKVEDFQTVSAGFLSLIHTLGCIKSTMAIDW